MISNEDFINQLVSEEGERLRPYTDSVGKLTIGVGRNLTDRGISQQESRYLLVNDINAVVATLDAQLPWWRKMNDVRQSVLADMCFNMGITKLLGFKNTLAMMKAGNYSGAADGMANSLWDHQTKSRADRLELWMRTGVKS